MPHSMVCPTGGLGGGGGGGYHRGPLGDNAYHSRVHHGLGNEFSKELKLGANFFNFCEAVRGSQWAGEQPHWTVDIQWSVGCS